MGGRGNRPTGGFDRHRRTLFQWAAVAALLLGNQLSAAAQPPPVLVLGDSISAAYGIAMEQGWVELLRKKLHAEGYPTPVVNASISGETTSGGLRRLPNLLDRHQPGLVILELGGNDGLRGFPLADIKANLQRMIELAQQSGAEVLLLGMRIPPNYGPAYTEPFFAQYQQLALTHDLRLVPFFLDGIAGDATLMQRDGIHPTAEAQPLLLAHIWPALRGLLSATDAQTEIHP